MCNPPNSIIIKATSKLAADHQGSVSLKDIPENKSTGLI
jgi:hypothetical protein